MFWMRTTGCVSKREEKAFSLSLLFVLIPHYKPCEKRLLYPLVKKLPTGQMSHFMGQPQWELRITLVIGREASRYC